MLGNVSRQALTQKKGLTKSETELTGGAATLGFVRELVKEWLGLCGGLLSSCGGRRRGGH